MTGALCAHHYAVAGAEVTITCPAQPRGAIVKIQIPGPSEILSLCEVEVHPSYTGDAVVF